MIACKNCRFAKQKEKVTPESYDCRRYPPVLGFNQAFKNQISIYPVVLPQMYCGEFKARETVSELKVIDAATEFKKEKGRPKKS